MPRLPLPPAEPIRLVHLADIAKGGMGSVQMARAEGGRFHGHIVAVKRLNENVAQDPQFVGMFLDEAWMTAALKSPNVISALAWGNDQSGMFLAVELVTGVSLSRLIKEARQHGEPFAERTAAYIGSQICSGLAAAHGLRGPDGALLGLVHRDLTPGNILVSFDGVVKIADFGIAKAEERITHTQTGTLKGKPAYMAPEQARGGKVDGRADVFSFGVMMFELLAGKKPWASKSAFDIMMEAATAPTPNLGEIRKGVSPVFVDIVNRCLAKKPEERFGSAGEIQSLLDGWRASRNFGADDQASLGNFVRRNSETQIAWFTQAMRGDFARAEAPTFKEVEEQIDESREKKKPPKPRPAAGSNDLAQMTPARVRPAAGMPPSPQSSRGVPQPPPSQRNVPNPMSPNPMPPPRPPSKSLAGTERLSDDARARGQAMASQRPASDPNPAGPLSRSPVNLGGTQLMAESPLAEYRRSGAPAAPPPPTAQTRPPTSDRGPTSSGRNLDLPPRRMGAADDGLHLPPKRMEAYSSAPPSRPYGAPASGPHSSTPAPAPFSAQAPAPFSAAPPQYSPQPYSAPGGGAASSSGNYTPSVAPAQPPQASAPIAPAPLASAPIASPPPSPAPKASGRGGTIALMVVLPLLLGGAGAAWVFRDRFMPHAPTPPAPTNVASGAPTAAASPVPSNVASAAPLDAGSHD